MLPLMRSVVDSLANLGGSLADTPVMSRTHGQPATPTTMGKEMVNFASRLDYAADVVTKTRIRGEYAGLYLECIELPHRCVSIVQGSSTAQSAATARTSQHTRVSLGRPSPVGLWRGTSALNTAPSPRRSESAQWPTHSRLTLMYSPCRLNPTTGWLSSTTGCRGITTSYWAWTATYGDTSL